MSKTTPEEAKALAQKHGALLTGNILTTLEFTQLAALIDEVRGVDAEPVFKGPVKWTAEEIAKNHTGIRWINPEGVHGRPTSHDIMDYLTRRGADAFCNCEACKAFYRTHPAPSQPAAPVELSVISWDVVTGKPLVFLSDAQAAIAAGRKAL